MTGSIKQDLHVCTMLRGCIVCVCLRKVCFAFRHVFTGDSIGVEQLSTELPESFEMGNSEYHLRSFPVHALTMFRVVLSRITGSVLWIHIKSIWKCLRFVFTTRMEFYPGVISHSDQDITTDSHGEILHKNKDTGSDNRGPISESHWNCNPNCSSS